MRQHVQHYSMAAPLPFQATTHGEACRLTRKGGEPWLQAPAGSWTTLQWFIGSSPA